MVVSYRALGASRPQLRLPKGEVSAEVAFRAADDGRSVIWTCHVENHSDGTVEQELFPDLHGLIPLPEWEETELRLPQAPSCTRSWTPHPRPGGGQILRDCTLLAPIPLRRRCALVPKASLRWLDYGSFGGGL